MDRIAQNTLNVAYKTQHYLAGMMAVSFDSHFNFWFISILIETIQYFLSQTYLAPFRKKTEG
jgi:hypothetical protein